MGQLDHRLTFQGVAKAAERLEGKVQRTPVNQYARISQAVNKTIFNVKSTETPPLELYLKFENMQTANSKFRGAAYLISQMDETALKRGIVAYSTGNHAMALASACKIVSAEKGFNVPVAVVVPKSTSRTKLDLIRSSGAMVFSFGESMDDCIELAHDIRRSAGMVLVPPNGHPRTLLGQGTAALEFHRQIQEELARDGAASDSSSDYTRSDDESPSLDVLMVPSAGSGLLAGTAVACHNTEINIIAAEPESGPPALNLFTNNGRKPSIPVGLGKSDLGSILTEQDWDLVRESPRVMGTFCTSDRDIKAASSLLMKESKMTIDSAGAVALSALLSNKEVHSRIAKIAADRIDGPVRVGVLISGGHPAVQAAIEQSERRSFTQRALDKMRSNSFEPPKGLNVN